MPDVSSIGEVMVQMNPVSGGPLRHARLYERHVAGSEANTLAGLQRLGVSTGFISRVGKDELGLAVLAELRAEGIDVSRVAVDPEAPTGVYFVQRGYPVQGKTLVFYYRANSAASRTGPEDVPEEALDGARMVHLSGITPVLSESCRQACLRLVELARKRKVPVGPGLSSFPSAGCYLAGPVLLPQLHSRAAGALCGDAVRTRLSGGPCGQERRGRCRQRRCNRRRP